MIDKILCIFGFILMVGMYGLLGAEVAYTSKLPVTDGYDLSMVLIAVVCAVLSTVVFIMFVKDCDRD